MNVEIIDCPNPECAAPAEVTDRWYANGAPLPVEMVTTACFDSHRYHGAADSLLRRCS
jgi:hypothetical protein